MPDRDSGGGGSSSNISRNSNADELAALQEQVSRLEGDLASEREYISQMDGESQRKDTLLKGLELDLAASETARRRLHNQVMELKGNIRVFCRVRPFMSSDAKNGDTPSELILRTSGDRPQMVINQAAAAGGKNQKPQEHAFEMDNIFMHDASQEKIFEEIEPLLQSVMDGYRLCIFAYGQTGSGKTHTMEGDLSNSENQGVIPRAAQAIFDQLSDPKFRDSEVTASYLEIYNEELSDLLVEGSTELKLQICEDNKPRGKGLFVQNLSEVNSLSIFLHARCFLGC